MRAPVIAPEDIDTAKIGVTQRPILLAHTRQLVAYLQTLSVMQLCMIMRISPGLADKTRHLLASWSDTPDRLRPAINSFLGDIYSGLQVTSWSADDYAYASTHLRILSGLYGILRPLDGIYPYRFEMGYRLPDEPFKNLYSFWGRSVSETLSADRIVVNLAAVEYSKVVTPFLLDRRIITPRFLTRNTLTGMPTFVVVHAKIARGAFARWLIQNRIEDADRLAAFQEIGYHYDSTLSSPNEPVYVCDQFGGTGLSVRLT